MLIRTKIVVTVGPASGKFEVLKELALAGADVFRINFSHGTNEQHGQFLENIRRVETELSAPLAVMGDLCGPKIRVGEIAGGSFLLAEGQQIAIQRESVEGTPERISTTMSELIDELDVGGLLLLDDGKIRLEVTETHRPREIICRIVQGGVLSAGKGVNVPDASLKVSALTEKDRRDVDWITGKDFDYVALSFVRSAEDVENLRRMISQRGITSHIIAKIEKPQSLDHIEEIIAAADGIMVARGDLGVEMDLTRVPVAQKRIARLSQHAGKPCIIATQMLESMTRSPSPTRAEVSDVANAVLDHADAVMLSGETAIGKFPVQSVRMMNGIVQEIQGYYDETCGTFEAVQSPIRTTVALTRAVRGLLEGEDVAAVAVFTATGATARLLSKTRLPKGILAMSPDLSAVRRMCLYYGVEARQAEAPKHTRDVLKLAGKLALQRGFARKGDKIAVLSGRPIGTPGATNTLVVHTVG